MAVPKQVLLVEDSSDIRFIAAKKLAAAGYQVIEAADGLEALHKMLENPACRLMLTDFVMPGFGGNSWIRLLERFCSDWTIVVMSSEDIDPGPFVLIPKPVDYNYCIEVFARVSS